MIDEKYIDMMNRSIDHDISPEERVELMSYLESNAEARRCYEELNAISHMFNNCSALDPPPQVRAQIMNTVRQEAAPTARARPVATIGFFAGLKHRFMPKYAYVFVAGLVVGICLYALLSQMGPPQDDSDLAKMYGTISRTAGDETDYVIDPLEFILPELSGHARYQCTEQYIFVNVDLVAKKEVELIMQYDDSMEFEGFRALDISDHDLAITGNRVALSHFGVSDYIIVFKKTMPSEPSINVKIFSSGELIFEETSIARRK